MLKTIPPWLRRYHSELYHYGVKGMKWGIRRTPEELGHKPKRNKFTPQLKNAAGHVIIPVQKTTIHGKPNSITQVVNKKGGIDRNYYDNNGLQIKQLSNNDHGNPRMHSFGKNGEHAHDYIYDQHGRLVKRAIRELNDEERLENDDFLRRK